MRDALARVGVTACGCGPASAGHEPRCPSARCACGHLRILHAEPLMDGACMALDCQCRHFASQPEGGS